MTCIEIKYANSPTLARGFYQSMQDLKPAHQYVIIPNGTAYCFNDQIKVSNLIDFIEQELPLISISISS
jgi:hypothetical protein